MNRREFIFYNAIGPMLNPGSLIDDLSKPEILLPKLDYFFTQTKTPVFAFKDAEVAKLGTILPGALLRIVPLDSDPNWAIIIQDSYLKIPSRPLSKKGLLIPTTTLKQLQASEMSTINPQVPLSQKHIEVSLRYPQTLRAYEWGDCLLHECTVSAGARSGWTPLGTHQIYRKTPSRYMQGADFDLPGVGFVQYFTGNGVALHSAYWREEEMFGRGYSHGCVNLRLEDARFLYRWTNPVQLNESWDKDQQSVGVLVKITI